MVDEYQSNMEKVKIRSVTIGVPIPLLQELDKASNDEYRSRNSYICHAIREKLNKQNENNN